MKTRSFVLLFLILLTIPISSLSRACASISEQNCLQGVWNDFDFSRPAEDWSDAGHRLGGVLGLVDLIVAQASNQDTVLFPFPFQESGNLTSYVESDLIEPYLDKFDSENLQVILSIQPLKSDVTQIIDILLSRYSHHSSLIGVNVDLEWKKSGNPNFVSNEERDLWLNKIKDKDAKLKLFLTYYEDYTHFPGDAENLVVLFDGEGDTQANLLMAYEKLADHYDSVGIYTGYASSSPPTASFQRITDAVPKTKYIIHTEDVFPDKPTLIFEMDDIEADWNERTTMDLTNLHLNKNIPVVCGVVPKNLDNASFGTGYLRSYLRDLSQNYFDIFEIAQLGYTNNDSESMRGKSYEEQKMIVENGLKALNSIGIEPSTFMPPGGSADETTLRVAEELKFNSFVDLYENLSSNKLLILNSWVTVTKTDMNKTVLKSPAQLMAEIDNKTDQNPIIVSYQVRDFATNTQNRLELSKIIDSLRSSKKYLFMTAKQYKETLDAESNPANNKATSRSPILPQWAFYLVIGASATTVLSIFSVRRHNSIKKRRKSKRKNAKAHQRTKACKVTVG